MKISEIERNVPIPKRTFSGGRVPKYPLKDMNIGDSFTIYPDKNEELNVIMGKVRNSVYSYVRRNKPKFKFKIYTCNDHIRCWRVK